MEKVYILEHIYEENEIEEIKFIGVFSSSEKAQSVINELSSFPGFNKYPIECFQISEEKIDHYEWKDGFISWDEAMK